MRKVYFLMLFLIGLLSCSFQSAKVINESSTDSTTVVTNQKENITEKKLASDSNAENIKRDYPIVFLGLIDFEPGKTDTLEDQVWSLARNEEQNLDEEPAVEINREQIIDVDIMNCAGYLGSAKASYDSGNGIYWKIKFIPETTVADSKERVKKCDADQKDDYVASMAFAIAPRSDKRKNIKIGEVDTAKVFSSLPKDVKKWLNEEKVFYKTESGANYRRKDKQNLSLKENAGWTDIDGDGKIDLVYVSSICSVGDEEGDTCGRILMLINGKWKQIGFTQKA